MERREFLKVSSLGAWSVVSMKANASSVTTMSNAQPTNLTWRRYNYSNVLNSLTLSSGKMPSRDQLLEMAMNNIPSPERVQQIHDVVMAHTIAEETADLDATMATLVDKPIYEDVASGKTFVGHQDVMDDYRTKYKAFPSMARHVTNMAIDKNGCFAELVWEGAQKGSIQGLKPPTNRPKIYLPVTVYWEVNEEGKIARETVYYDQYLMLLNLDIIPDIVNKPLTLMFLNPGLMLRRE